jgi:GLPGLI family protein
MKHLIIGILLLMDISLFAQSVRVEYLEESKRELPPGSSQAAIDFMRFTKAVLIATPERSWYETERDSIMVEKVEVSSIDPEILKKIPLKGDMQQNITSRRRWFRVMSAQYKEFITRVNASYTTLYGEKLHVERPLQVYDWIINNETTVVAGMMCKKATATLPSQSAIEAWFTDEIPLANGPAIYHGLPGLILKIEAEHITISATKVSFIEKPEIKRWENSRLVAEDNLNEALRQIRIDKKSQAAKQEN